jgi:hypothetical protein
MTILKKTFKVTPDRRIVVELPPDTPLGEVQVEVRVEDAAKRPGNAQDILDLVDEIRKQQRNDPNFRPRSKEEIDEYLRIERESWD